MEVVALRAKTNPCMKRSTSIIPVITTLFAGLCSTMLHAQLAQLYPPAPEAPDVRTAPAPIHDDGDDLLHLEDGLHLVVAYQCLEAGERIMELLDETGHSLWTLRQQSEAGQRLVPIDLGTLASGRYLLRVLHGGALEQSRIVRP